MYRGGRGGRRPYDRNYEGNRQQHRKDFSSRHENKNEWVSYKRPADKAPVNKTPIKENEKPVATTAANNVTLKSNVQVKVEKPVVQVQAKVTPKRETTESPKNSMPVVPPPKLKTNFSSTTIPVPVTPKTEHLEHNPEGNSFNSTPGVTRYQGKEGEKKFSGRCRLFIANMNNSTTEEELRELFGQFGETGEVFVNKDKGFGFIRLDFRHNAEIAKSSLDKKLFKGRNIQVRFATHASAIELHGLDMFASNEFIENAMSQFGQVERAVVVCDDRGRSKGHAIVEFAWKKSAQKVLDRFKGEMFVLGRLPKPVFAKPLIQVDEEEGVKDQDIERLQGFQNERNFAPRFISPSSFEYTWAKKWRDLYIEEEDKKARLEQELRDSRYKLELEMEAANQQQEAGKMREELRQRQEELRRLEEDLMKRQELSMRIGREQIERNRDYRGQPIPAGRDENMSNNNGPPNEMINNDIGQPNIIQQADLDMRQRDILRAAGVQMLGLRPEMLGPGGMPLGGLPPHAAALIQGLPGGPMGPGGPRQMHPPGMHMHVRPPHGVQGGPPPREMHPHHRGDRFDHKRPRRD